MIRFICAWLALLGILYAPQLALADKADALVREEMQKHQIAGLSLMVIRDGRPIKTKPYGKANLEWDVPVTTDTVFEIGSITKQFTAACILLLQQDGKLSVEDKISKYLTNTPPSWSNITIRQLLTHTSGIRNYTGHDGFELTKHQTQQQFIQKLAALPSSFQPGEKWSYCNSGYSLLGYIVENVSGKNYWDFLRERITGPLGMTVTRDRTPGAVIPRRAAGYELTNHVHINRDYDITDVFSAGAMVSTVLDLAKWNAALDGETLLNKTSKEQWWTPTTLNNGHVQNYGFGWYLDPLKGHKNIGHNGATSGFSSSIQRFPDDHLCVIVLCNADDGGTPALAGVIAKEVAPLYFNR